MATLCRCCWRKHVLRNHPYTRYLDTWGPSICRKCLDVYRESDKRGWTTIGGNDMSCRICGEGDLFLVHCGRCKNGFCAGCILGNFGERALIEIKKLYFQRKLICFKCDPTNWPHKLLRSPDIRCRIKYGEFSPRTFISLRSGNAQRVAQIDGNGGKLLSEHSSNPCELVRVVSVCWFVSETVFTEGKLTDQETALKYFLGLASNIEKLGKFQGWIMRIYYDGSVSRANPEIIPKVLEGLKKHPKIQLVKFPDWPEFKRYNGLYRNLLPCLFRFLILEEEGFDVVLCRDIDSVLSVPDRKNIENWIENTKKPFHRYFCSKYGWPLCAGTIGFRSKNRAPIKPNIRKMILDFARQHMKSPLSLRPFLQKRAGKLEVVDWEDNYCQPFPYYCDQVFLEEKIFVEMEEKDIQTEMMCIARTHAKTVRELERIDKRKKKRDRCQKCKIPRFESLFLPTILPNWIDTYTPEKVEDVENTLKRKSWARIYLYNSSPKVNNKRKMNQLGLPSRESMVPSRVILMEDSSDDDLMSDDGSDTEEIEN